MGNEFLGAAVFLSKGVMRMNEVNTYQKINKQERGAVLIMVLVISLILSIACISMLTAVGAGSRNSTDVLSETKAYYAAESGLQATINVLRGNTDITPLNTSDNINYVKASTPVTSNYSGDSSTTARLSAWLPYNYPTSGTPDRVVIGQAPNVYTPNSGAAYSISISDPDNTKNSTTFSTVGTPVSFPSADAANKVTISFTDVTNHTISFLNSGASNPLFSTLQITTSGSGPAAPWTANILINYTITSPRQGTRTIRGTISKAAPSNSVPNPSTIIKFDNSALMGSEVNFCQTATNPCTSFSRELSLTAGVTTSVPIYMHTFPLQPYRLKVTSTGYGPNGAKKQLEAIIQKNFFNDESSPTSFMMQGSSQGMIFSPGNSSGFSISGVDGTNGVTIPSVGVINQAGLTTVLNGIPNNNPNINPAPAIVTDIPAWMATPQNLDALISKLRTTAQNSGRYFLNPTQNLNNVGDFDTGKGITFCEGDCTAGADGGGILVVTGQLRNIGGWRFKGLIIVTGAEGWLRNGGGSGVVIGNVVIAPYTSANLVSNIFTLPPKYQVTGSGTSDIIYDQNLFFNLTLNGTDAVTDFMLGVAEK
jgi:hypothetical protein